MIRSSFKQACFALAIAALVAGCSSGVDLDKAPVEDKGATPTVPSNSNSSQNGIAPVDLTQSSLPGQGPANVAHVIYFGFDSFVVKPEFQSTLESHAKYLKSHTTRKVMLEGHTDERGGREYNLALGQKRAEAVRRSLGLLGVPDGQMEAVSFGKEKPAVQGHTEDAFAQNRRVELSYR